MDLNHIFLFLAVISPLLVLARGWRPGAPYHGWRIAAIVVLGVTAVAWILAPRTAGYKGDFGIIEHTRDIRWRQAPGERARDTVAVSCCKNVAADVRQVTEVEDEFCGPSEASQLRGVSAVDGFSKLMAGVQRRNRDNRSRYDACEWHLIRA